MEETIWRICPEKGSTDLSLTAGEICKWANWRIKKFNTKLRYVYKLHYMRYIDDVKKLKQRHVLEPVEVHVFRFLKRIFYVNCYALETNYSVLYMKF